MERLEPTRALALKVWWAFIWRAVLLTMAGGFLLGVVFGLLGALLGLGVDALSGLAGFLGLVLGAVVSVEVMFRILKKKFAGFELALLHDPERGE